MADKCYSFKPYMWIFSSFVTTILMPIMILLAMAFFTLMERKFLGYSQMRKGPNKCSFAGAPQPLADALKLFSKNQSYPAFTQPMTFKTFPLIALLLSLLLWILLPSNAPTSFLPFSVIAFLCISALNVYIIMGAGWSSNSKYALLGALRGIAQTISYEIPMTMTILSIIIILSTFDLQDILNSNYLTLAMCPYILIIWLMSCLAETNRAPFDHAEGESELVSGFNTEYSGGSFALLFMAEYVNILFLSYLTSLMFINISSTLFLFFTTILLAMWFVWIRSTLPRVRYDVLMNFAWKFLLPSSLTILLLIIPMKNWLF